jgi:1,4-dihydroxy-2-naphthoate octaprenyltransferase
MIMVHQLLDHDNDIATATRTTATVLGLYLTQNLVKVIFALELAATLLLVILLVGAGLHIGLLLPFLWPVFALVLYLRRGGRLQLDSYHYIPLADLHESLIPLIIAASLIMRDGVAQIGNMLLLVVLFGRRHFERLVLPLWGERLR